MKRRIFALLLAVTVLFSCASCSTITITIPVNLEPAQNVPADTNTTPAATEPAQTQADQTAAPADTAELSTPRIIIKKRPLPHG